MKISKFSTKFILLIILLFASIFYSCNNTITNPSNGIGTNAFPNKIGNEWKYFFYDSLSNSADTVIVSIIGDTTFRENRTAKIWQYNYRDKIEFHFVEILHDTVRIYDNLVRLWDNTKFVFPLKKNGSWNGDFLNDTSSVNNISVINVFAGHFENGYLIKESWGLFNDYGEILTWFVPGIGIVKKHHSRWGFGYANNYWELMEYTIK